MVFNRDNTTNLQRYRG